MEVLGKNEHFCLQFVFLITNSTIIINEMKKVQIDISTSAWFSVTIECWWEQATFFWSVYIVLLHGIGMSYILIPFVTSIIYQIQEEYRRSFNE